MSPSSRPSRPPAELTVLERLVPEGKRLLTPELASGGLDRHPPSVIAPYLEMLDRAVDLAPLAAAVDDAVRAVPPHEPELDRRLAPALHRALPLTRREASDAAVWRFLAVGWRPSLVRHRWENRSWTSMRARFWAPGTRPDSNTFGRLWWIAELTVDGAGGYALTERVLARQSLANALFVRSFSAWKPLVAAAVTVLEDAPADAIDRTLVALSRFAATVPLEGLEEPALVAVIERLLARGR